jgi:hypothetical protein
MLFLTTYRCENKTKTCIRFSTKRKFSEFFYSSFLYTQHTTHNTQHTTHTHTHTHAHTQIFKDYSWLQFLPRSRARSNLIIYPHTPRAHAHTHTHTRARTHTNIQRLLLATISAQATIKKKTPWSESTSELYRPSDRRLSAK